MSLFELLYSQLFPSLLPAQVHGFIQYDEDGYLIEDDEDDDDDDFFNDDEGFEDDEDEDDEDDDELEWE